MWSRFRIARFAQLQTVWLSLGTRTPARKKKIDPGFSRSVGLYAQVSGREREGVCKPGLATAPHLALQLPADKGWGGEGEEHWFEYLHDAKNNTRSTRAQCRQGCLPISLAATKASKQWCLPALSGRPLCAPALCTAPAAVCPAWRRRVLDSMPWPKGVVMMMMICTVQPHWRKFLKFFNSFHQMTTQRW